MKKLSWLLLSSYLLLASSVFAEDLKQDQRQDPKQELLARLAKHTTLQADFTQTILDERDRVVQRAKGKMKLSKPSRFYWAIAAPGNQIIIADGHTIWVYDKDLSQVVKRSQQQLSTLPAQLLSGGLTDLGPGYQVRASGSSTQRHYVVEAHGVEAGFQHLELDFLEHRLRAMVLVDSMGQQSKFQFTHVVLDAPIPAALYHFTPPKGTDLIDDAS